MHQESLRWTKSKRTTPLRRLRIQSKSLNLNLLPIVSNRLQRNRLPPNVFSLQSVVLELTSPKWASISISLKHYLKTCEKKFLLSTSENKHELQHLPVNLQRSIRRFWKLSRLIFVTNFSKRRPLNDDVKHGKLIVNRTRRLGHLDLQSISTLSHHWKVPYAKQFYSIKTTISSHSSHHT